MIHMALDLIFRPLTRLAIAKGVRFADASERLRRAYLFAALQVAGRDVTDSKLSVMTGLQRRDVARLRAEPEEAAPRPDPLSRLVALWLAEHAGAPLSRSGGAVSFDALARRIRKDIHPRTSLDALVAAGTVGLDGDTVRLLKQAYVPLEGSDDQLRYLGQNVGDHMAVAVGNVLGERMSPELAVHYDGLSDAAIETLREMWRDRMGTVLQEMNARALALQDDSPGAGRFRAGGYFQGER
ncbi:MAG: DUF6502 family protein [Pseudomonadota bacterium]